MKKMWVALFVSLAFTLSAVGCGNSAFSQSIQEPTAIANTPEASPGMEGPVGTDGMDAPPDESRMRNPFENMVFGRVESIVGNEVVLELGEVDTEQMQEAMRERTQRGENGETAADGEQPQRTPPAGAGERPSGGGSGRQGGAPGSWEGGQRPEGGQFPEEGEFPAAGMDGAGMPNRGGMSGSGFLSQLEIQYTGETATYLSPVGIQIGASDYTSITAGMVLGLTLDEEGDISAVMIISN